MATVQQMIASVAGEYGVPAWIPEDIAYVESQFHPGAVGDNGTSFGLFQLHVGGGQGDGYSLQTLLNPLANTTIAMQTISQAYKAGRAQGLTGFQLLSYVADHSGHPDETGYMPPSYEQSLYAAYSGQAAAAGAVQAGVSGAAAGFADMSFQATATQGAPDWIDAIDNALKFQGVDLKTFTSPGQWFLGNIEAFFLRVALVLLGLILVVFGLVKVIGSDRMMDLLPLAAMG